MTLSGGTTGLSLSMRLSRRLGDRMWEVRDKDGFMMRACGEREKKYVLYGWSVMA